MALTDMLPRFLRRVRSVDPLERLRRIDAEYERDRRTGRLLIEVQYRQGEPHRVKSEPEEYDDLK